MTTTLLLQLLSSDLKKVIHFLILQTYKHLIPPDQSYFYMTSQMPGVATRQVMNNQN